MEWNQSTGDTMKQEIALLLPDCYEIFRSRGMVK